MKNRRIIKITYFILCFICFSLALSNENIQNDILKKLLCSTMLVASGYYATEEIKNKIKN